MYNGVWTKICDAKGVSRAFATARPSNIGCFEIAMLGSDYAELGRERLEKAAAPAAFSTDLPREIWASYNILSAIVNPKRVIQKTASLWVESRVGVTSVGKGERPGLSPTEQKLDNVAMAPETATKCANNNGLARTMGNPINKASGFGDGLFFWHPMTKWLNLAVGQTLSFLRGKTQQHGFV